MGVRVYALLVLFSLAVAFFHGVIGAGAAGEKFPYWIRPGLRVAYVVSAGSASISPWESMEATLKHEGPWDAKYTIPEQAGKASMLGIYEHYVVEGVDGKGVHMRFEAWTSYGGAWEAARRSADLLSPFRRPFNGPFWVDPLLLRDARVGGTVSIPRENGEPLTYQVFLAGRYDISPLSEAGDSLTSRTGVSPSLPVPPGTYREVVGLRTMLTVKLVKGGKETTGKVVHEMLVDRETGLILVDGVTLREGGVQETGEAKRIEASVYMRSLAEINMDLEDRLPSYRERSYDYGPLLHTGYSVQVDGVFNPPGEGPGLSTVIASARVEVFAAYKNTIVVARMFFLGVNPSPIAYAFSDVEDLETGETTIVYRYDMVSGEGEKMSSKHSQGPVLLRRSLLGRETVEVYSVEYRLQGSFEREVPGLGKTRLYAYVTSEERAMLHSLLYAETPAGGVLVALEPGGLPGAEFQPQGRPPDTASVLAALDERARRAAGQPGWEKVDVEKVLGREYAGDAGTGQGGQVQGGSGASQEGAAVGTATQEATARPQPAVGGGLDPFLAAGGAAAGLAVVAAVVLVARRARTGAPAPPPPPPPGH